MVYHIFTDLSDMDWQQKLAVFYNLSVHNEDKIVEPPDTEKWQIHKVERGNLKLQMVIDQSVPVAG
jgi:hypothetical protein